MKFNQNLLAVFFFISYAMFSQENKPKISLNILANDNISEVNINQDKYIATIGKIIKHFEKEFKTLPKEDKIGVLIISHKAGNPTIKVYSEPKIDDAKEQKIITDIKAYKLENTKLVDFPVFISVNTKSEKEITEFKDYKDPIQQKLEEYEKANLATKIQLNKDYAINEILPVLSAYQVIVDDKFAGVKNFGKLIEKTDFSKIQNTAKLTDKNPDYWRACMEMSNGNLLIPITKTFILVSQGEFDYAYKYTEILKIFADKESIATKYLKDLEWRLKLFNDTLNHEIEKGITEHDKGNYDKAIEIYQNTKKIYPNSSWNLYELYFSQNIKDVNNKKIESTDRTQWDNDKIEIYKHNPLYNMDVRASNAKEAYLLFRRQEIQTLFRNKNELLQDINKYADIALDLGVYDFSAQLFWLAAPYMKNDSETAIHKCLYSLEKLGVKNLKENFKGNFNSIFKKIEKEKEKEMQENALYKSMKD